MINKEEYIKTITDKQKSYNYLEDGYKEFLDDCISKVYLDTILRSANRDMAFKFAIRLDFLFDVEYVSYVLERTQFHLERANYNAWEVTDDEVIYSCVRVDIESSEHHDVKHYVMDPFRMDDWLKCGKPKTVEEHNELVKKELEKVDKNYFSRFISFCFDLWNGEKYKK